MNMFRPLIEKKLSGIFGAEVTFGGLKISPFRGSLEAEEMTVCGDDADWPVLKIRRLKAEISVSKALAGQITIKSILIEEPVATIILKADGSTNLPGIARSLADPTSAAPQAQRERAGWQLATGAIQIVDGQAHFYDQTGGSAYHASAEKINGHLREDAAYTRFNLTMEPSRRDRELLLGNIQLIGSFACGAEVSQLLRSPLEA